MSELPLHRAIGAAYRQLAHAAPRGTYSGYEREMIDAYVQACAAGFARGGLVSLGSAAARGAFDLLRQNGRAWKARLTGRSSLTPAGWRRQGAGSQRPPRTQQHGRRSILVELTQALRAARRAG